MYLQNPPAGNLAVSKGHPGDADPKMYKGKSKIVNHNRVVKFIVDVNNFFKNGFLTQGCS